MDAARGKNAYFWHFFGAQIDILRDFVPQLTGFLVVIDRKHM